MTCGPYLLLVAAILLGVCVTLFCLYRSQKNWREHYEEEHRKGSLRRIKLESDLRFAKTTLEWMAIRMVHDNVVLRVLGLNDERTPKLLIRCNAAVEMAKDTLNDPRW